MKVHETDDYYVVTFFPDAEEIKIDDKTDEKGYKAIIGSQEGHHVIMKVMYSKERYPLNIDEVKKRGLPEDTKTVLDYYALRIGDCPICKRLDENVDKITELRLLDNVPMDRAAPFVQDAPVTPVATSTVTTPKSELFNTGNPLQDLMTRMMFDTKLNTTGQVATALALEDSDLLERVMPKSIDGVVTLMANLTELSQGKGDIYRSPEEVVAYVKALREGVKQPIDEKSPDKKEIPVFRRASTIIVS